MKSSLRVFSEAAEAAASDSFYGPEIADAIWSQALGGRGGSRAGGRGEGRSRGGAGRASRA